MGLTKIEPHEYYRINGTKKILYWDDEKWIKPEEDSRKNYGTYNSHLQKQPTNITSVELVDIRTIY
jgi:hypothetical protein